MTVIRLMMNFNNYKSIGVDPDYQAMDEPTFMMIDYYQIKL